MNTPRVLVSGLASILAVLHLAPAAAAQGAIKDHGSIQLRAELTGAAEAPTPGDPDGVGRAKVKLRLDRGELEFHLSASGIDLPTAAHIHRGAVGAPGPVVVPLAAPVDGRSRGRVPVDAALLAEIAADPAAFYVNVHNAEYPAGALRGQLALNMEDAEPGEDVEPAKLEADLDGPSEVPTPGDPDGKGEAEIKIRIELGVLDFALEVEGIDLPTAAHIHRGAVGVPGPVVVPLAAPVDGHARGRVTVDAALLAEIAADPAACYVNGHNAEYPAGALRGQLVLKMEDAKPAKLEADLDGPSEVPTPGDPDGKGEAEIKIRLELGALDFALEVEGIATPTAAHIHRGAVGVPGPVVVPLAAPVDGHSRGRVTVDPALLAEIVADPAAFYVNVHNADYPAGAVRGQLRTKAKPVPGMGAKHTIVSSGRVGRPTPAFASR